MQAPMKTLDVLVAYNEPTLSPNDPDSASEAGVLESVEAVTAALSARGHHVRQLGITSSGQLLDVLPNLSADVVFNLFEGFGGVGRGESEVAGLLEMLDYPLTGSPSPALALVRDKPRAKWLLRGAGVSTPPFEVAWEETSIDWQPLAALLAGGAVIVKPAHEDGSLGIGRQSIVSDLAALKRQVESVRERYGRVLVERFVVGREFNAAVIALPQTRLLPLSEIEFCGAGERGWQIVTYESKWEPGGVDDRASPARCPVQLEPALEARLREAALSAFRLAGCRQYARIDMRMDRDGAVYILEINANPDIDPKAGFARQLKADGISYDHFIDQMVRVAVQEANASCVATGRSAN
jgi:D-alanine-D-alanine ligase